MLSAYLRQGRWSRNIFTIEQTPDRTYGQAGPSHIGDRGVRLDPAECNVDPRTWPLS